MFTLQKPVFYTNPDTSHCVQACLKSILSVTHPDRKFSWEELEKLTDYLPEHGAWVYAELLSLNKLSLETRLISSFNISRFKQEGLGYIEKEYGKEVADYERKHPHDIEKIKRQMQESLVKHLVISRSATEGDVKNYIKDGWYVMPLLNSKALNSKLGYTGHRILVYGYDEKGVIAHDPGPNDKNNTEDRFITWKQLERAWQNANELVAVKLKTRFPSS